MCRVKGQFVSKRIVISIGRIQNLEAFNIAFFNQSDFLL